MIQYEDECVGCPTYCISCGRKRVPHYYCDECGEEIDPDDLYRDVDELLCEYCLHKRYSVKPENL